MSKPEPLQYDTFYHIYNRGNNGETIFRTKENYHYFLQLYTKHFHPYADTYAYSLQPNHFHFATRIKTELEIEETLKTLRVSETLRVLKRPSTPSQAFSNLCNAYAKAVNKVYGRSGSLLEHPFGRIPVTSERYFYNLIIYIHRNAQHHGLTDDFRDWPYSSYSAITFDKPTRVCKTAVLDQFGGLSSFIEAHQSDPDGVDLKTLRVSENP